MNNTENLHVRKLTPLISPEAVKSLYPASKKSIKTVQNGRSTVINALRRPKDANYKLIVVVGPCSIHDPLAALEYATWIKKQRQKFGQVLELVMRVYFEKPRTTVGWKGLINDPYLDESYDINSGLKIARKLVCDITDMGVPIGTELLDTVTPQYFAGLISWGAIGARTTESQLHRELASGLSFPVGFKNSTDGNIKVAVDAIKSASNPHHFPAITEEGQAAIAATSGNPDCHIVLRGGTQSTNYDAMSISQAVDMLKDEGYTPRIMVDCSHANSQKDHTKQINVAINIANQITRGNQFIFGVMIESNLKEGCQPFNPNGPMEYGKSITDACVGLKETEKILNILSGAIKSL
jgi:3-deoxy-7-phosphoheptulonate synthase